MTQLRRRITRTTVLFIVGLLGILAETTYSLLYRETPDPELVIAFVTMMGLPSFLNRDLRDENERRRRDNGDNDPTPDRQDEHDDDTAR